MNIPTATGARRWTRSLIAAVSLAAALPAAAEAGTAEVRDGELLYTARNAEVNNVNLRLGPTGKLVISDTAAKVAGAGCLLNGSGDLECDAASVTSIEVSLADRNDVMRYRAPHPGVVRAGLGSDTFFGGLRATPSGAVSYRGDEGLADALRYTEADRGVTVTLASGANDGRLGDLENAGADIETLEGSRFGDALTGSADDIGELFLGGNGNDTINGGDGPDRIDEGNARNGADTIDGGLGRDMIDYSRRDTGTGVTLNDIAEDGERTNIVEGDNVKSSIEDVITGRGSDIVHGNRQSNDIRTGAGFDIIASTVLNLGQFEVGGDTINPGRGTDTILAGKLGDVISARDGESDHIDCREGLDFATTDVIDRDPGNGTVPQNSDQISECEAVDAPDLP